jgi:hypothetical protein
LKGKGIEIVRLAQTHLKEKSFDISNLPMIHVQYAYSFTPVLKAFAAIAATSQT